MFEYLMPLIVMPSYPRTLLDETCRSVVDRQIEYGRTRNVPWGVSEAGYAKTDAQLNYQYRSFGVPGLGFKRGLADDLVITPYASALALMVSPRAAAANLRRLAAEGVLGAWGFFEAVDYTASRLPPGKSSILVRSYMAHHQGMTFLSILSVLMDQPMQKRFVADASPRATERLLQERVPKTAPIFPNPAEVSTVGLTPPEAAANFRVFTTPSTPRPQVHLLSNGSYHVAVTNAGGGYARWRDIALGGTKTQPGIAGGTFATCATCTAARRGPWLTSRPSSAPPNTRRSFRWGAPSFAALMGALRPTWRSASRPKKTWSSVVSASPIAAARRAPLTSPATPRWCSPPPPLTPPILPSAISLCRRSCWKPSRRSSAPVARARGPRRRRGFCT